MIGYITTGIIAFIAFIFFIGGIRIIRPNERGTVEFLGKYVRPAKMGFNWVFPILYQVYTVPITEDMVDAQTQEVITKDNLNAKVDAQVYFKIKDNREDIYSSLYRVANYRKQIVALASTTLRNIMGTMKLVDANSKRSQINEDLMVTLVKETKNWGIEVVRTELKEITPPADVQDTMNQVVVAENKKIAALDFATAAETKADGERRAKIKEADGQRQSDILMAEGEAKARVLKAEAEAKAIKAVNNALIETFKGEAQEFKKLEVTQQSLMAGTKYVIDSHSNLVNVMSEVAGIKPIPMKEEKK